MSSTIAIKSRIRSVKSTRQITKAMELVAASKMRRAQEATLASRTYAAAARELLTRLSQLTDVKRHPLFIKRTVKSRLIILVTSDRGLAGAYDGNMIKLYAKELKLDRDAGATTRTITIGRKGSNFVARLRDIETIGAYHEFPDIPDANQLSPIITLAVKLYRDQVVDAVDVIFTDYVNSLKQTPMMRRLLPAGFVESTVSHAIHTADFEPSADEVLESATERLIEAQLYQTLHDARASEYSMRMIAMRNATDNATSLVDDLTLAFNNARQTAITQELAEITGGAEALNG